MSKEDSFQMTISHTPPVADFPAREEDTNTIMNISQEEFDEMFLNWSYLNITYFVHKNATELGKSLEGNLK